MKDKILIVDDYAPLSQVFSMSFKLLEIDSDLAESSADAYLLLESGNLYRFMTLDIQMPPGENGIEFANRLEKHEKYSKIPIFIVSSLVEKHKKEISNLKNVRKSYSKPVSTEDIEEMIELTQ